MGITIKNELDPWFEVIGLLSMHYTENWDEITVRELNQYGIDGEEFYARHYKLIEKYLKTFQKYKADNPLEAAFFQDTATPSLVGLLLTVMAIELRDYLNRPLPWDTDRLRSLMAYYLTDENDYAGMPDESDLIKLPDDRSVIEFLDHLDAAGEEKWRLLELMRSPDVWLKQLLEIVASNIPACEKALASISAPLDKLMKSSASREDPAFLKLAETCGSNPVIYTSLAMPLIQLITYSYSYQGIFNEYLENRGGSADTFSENVIRQMKALSDKSKLDILSALKSSSMYNLELAEKLGLSPSTISHHMSYFLSCGFVSVEKKNGKVYYCLEHQSVRKFLNDLEKILL